jgi:prevent-host-death family protein
LRVSPKKVNYSKARSELRSLIEEVHRTGRPVTILRRGKPEAVLINYEEFERKLAKKPAKPWRLKGSIRIPRNLDIDEAIREHRKEMRDALEARLATYRRSLRS